MTIPARIARVVAECRGVWSASGITSFERARLTEWKDRTSLSPNQLKVLEQIEEKVFGDDDD